MIVGVGVDVVHIPTFAEQLSDPHSLFAEATFTPGERAQARARPSGKVARHLAARFAAKEAFIKAWSGGRWQRPPLLSEVAMTEIEVIHDAWGRPALRLHGEVALALDPGVSSHLSLSHDGDIAFAQVVLEREPGLPVT